MKTLLMLFSLSSLIHPAFAADRILGSYDANKIHCEAHEETQRVLYVAESQPVGMRKPWNKSLREDLLLCGSQVAFARITDQPVEIWKRGGVNLKGLQVDGGGNHAVEYGIVQAPNARLRCERRPHYTGGTLYFDEMPVDDSGRGCDALAFAQSQASGVFWYFGAGPGVYRETIRPYRAGREKFSLQAKFFLDAQRLGVRLAPEDKRVITFVFDHKEFGRTKAAWTEIGALVDYESFERRIALARYFDHAVIFDQRTNEITIEAFDEKQKVEIRAPAERFACGTEDGMTGKAYLYLDGLALDRKPENCELALAAAKAKGWNLQVNVDGDGVHGPIGLAPAR